MHQGEIIEQPTAQLTSLPFVPLNQERTMVKRVELASKRIKPERTNALVTKPETTPLTSLMPIPASTTTSHDFPTTPTTAKALLLLTSGPQFDRIETLACSAFAKSLESKSHHTDKLPYEEPSNADAFPDPAEVQIHLILANQQTFMANQCNLERRMDKLEQLMLQILKAVQKGKDSK